MNLMVFEHHRQLVIDALRRGEVDYPPYVIRSGGLIAALGPEAGRKAVHPDTQDVTLACAGFNDKNHYDRQRFALLLLPEFAEILLELAEDARAKLLRKMRLLKRDLYQLLENARSL